VAQQKNLIPTTPAACVNGASHFKRPVYEWFSPNIVFGIEKRKGKMTMLA